MTKHEFGVYRVSLLMTYCGNQTFPHKGKSCELLFLGLDQVAACNLFPKPHYGQLNFYPIIDQNNKHVDLFNDLEYFNVI